MVEYPSSSEIAGIKLAEVCINGGKLTKYNMLY